MRKQSRKLSKQLHRWHRVRAGGVCEQRQARAGGARVAQVRACGVRATEVVASGQSTCGASGARDAGAGGASGASVAERVRSGHGLGSTWTMRAGDAGGVWVRSARMRARAGGRASGATAAGGHPAYVPICLAF